MTAREAIIDLLSKAQDDYEWGGGETSDGVLHRGHVDWDELKKDITLILDRENVK